MTQISANGETDRQTYLVIGAAMAVHSELGHGFLEPVYHEALEREFVEQAVPYERERALPIIYRGRPLTATYRARFRLLRQFNCRAEGPCKAVWNRRGPSY